MSGRKDSWRQRASTVKAQTHKTTHLPLLDYKMWVEGGGGEEGGCKL